MKTVLVRTLAGLLLFTVTILAAFTTLRLFIHGREVSVPNLAGLSDADATLAAKKLGLNLSIENRFYSAAIAPNHVLSQSPIAGSRVRRGWQVRIAESLGGQKISVPDVTGQSERPADLVLRRLQLEVGNIVHLPAPTPADIVLAQSPPASAPALTGPRVALLVSDADAAPSSIAYVMPLINGMSVAAANARLSSAGLRNVSASDPSAVVATPAVATDPTQPQPDPAIPATIVSPPEVSPYAIILTQSPAPGRRVTRADTIRVTVEHTDTSADPILPPTL